MIVKVSTVEPNKFLSSVKEFLFEEAGKGISRDMREIPDYMWDFVCSKVTDVRYSSNFTGLYEIAGTIAECDTENKEVKPEKENVKYLWMIPAIFYVKDDITGTDGLSFVETRRAANVFINEMQVRIGLNKALGETNEV
jgi:hypothetical protein